MFFILRRGWDRGVVLCILLYQTPTQNATMPLFLSIFANDSAASLGLQEESRVLRSYFGGPDALFEYQERIFTDFSILTEALNAAHQELAILHFAGHSDKSGVELLDGALKPDILGRLLQVEPGLQLVFLNGCANLALVDSLLAYEIPLVMATNALIRDEQAVQVAHDFYGNLKAGLTFEGAFDRTAAQFDHRYHHQLGLYRGIELKTSSPGRDAFPWGLYASAAGNRLLKQTLQQGLHFSFGHQQLEDWKKEVEAQVLKNLGGAIRELLKRVRSSTQWGRAVIIQAANYQDFLGRESAGLEPSRVELNKIRNTLLGIIQYLEPDDLVD